MQYQTPAGITVAAQATPAERLSFIRKVYGLTFLGVAVFFLSALLPIVGAANGVAAMEGVISLALRIPWWAALLMIMGIGFLAQMVQQVKGLNLLAYFAVSVVWGFLSISLVLYATAIGGPIILVQALAITTIVMGGLTAFVFITRKDFSFMGSFLAVGLFIVLGSIIVLGIASMMGYQTEMLHVALSIGMVILFSGYVLYDTSKILHHYPTNMVVAAALAIMIDFVILFRQILFLLAVSRD